MEGNNNSQKDAQIFQLQLGNEEETRAILLAHQKNVENIFNIVKDFSVGKEQEEIVAQFFPNRFVNEEENEYFKLVMKDICAMNAQSLCVEK